MNMLTTDSEDYHVLSNAVKQIKDVPGIVCEIGTRRGGSMKLIIDTLLENNDLNRNVIGLDPYGNIGYSSSEGYIVRYDYTNAMRNETFTALYSYVQNKPVNLVMHILEDTEFFKRYADGVPFYHDYKTVLKDYSLIFFDGPHDIKSVLDEMEFFKSRAPAGSMWVIDDIHVFPYDILKQWLLDNNFAVFEESRVKASFKKL